MLPTLKRARVDEAAATPNEPRLIVYVTPRPLSCMTQNYMPPEEDCARIRDLWALNVMPQINASAQPSLADIRSTCGYVLIQGPHAPHALTELVKTTTYEPREGDERIVLLHWYPVPLTNAELDAMMPLWAEFYSSDKFEFDGFTVAGMPYSLPPDYAYLVERGALGRGTPQAVSKEVFEPVGSLPEEPSSSSQPSISCA